MKNPPHKPQEEEWEDPYPKKKKTHWFTALVLAIVLYVLSFGPVTAFVVSKGIISPETHQTIYYPLFALSRSSPAFNNAFDWYLGLWG